jgi:hypothetical protein
VFQKFKQKDNLFQLLLFCVSATIFSYYFQEALGSLNSKLSSADGDSIKNYYTYVYHTVNDSSILNFTGMHYPYGEHFIYTDCQPILTILFRYLPFTHNYLIGLLHFLILFSYVISPNILYRIFRLSNLSIFTSFCSALAIGLLSPQLQRIGGHFALAYGFVIPLSYFLNLSYYKSPTTRKLIGISIYNFLLFFVHPYLGFGCSLVSFLGLAIFHFSISNLKKPISKGALAAAIGLLPILLFRVFMIVSDQHANRTTEPFGIGEIVAKPESVFVPAFGPFEHLLKQIIPTGHREWEGLSYIGLFPFALLVTVLFLIILIRRRPLFDKGVTAIFIVSVVLLIFSFGYHNQLLKELNIDIGLIKQFRALGRFAWFFYFAVSIFSVVVFTRFTNQLRNFKLARILSITAPALLLIFNTIEGHFYLTANSHEYLKTPNIFNKEYLSEKENELLKELSTKKFTAIAPIPLYYIGSEMFEKDGMESTYLSMLLSYHLNKPLIAAMMSRTSITEAKDNMELFNPYKKSNPSAMAISQDTVLVLKAGVTQKPNEDRLLRKLKNKITFGTYEYYLCSGTELVEEKTDEPFKFDLSSGVNHIDTLNVIYTFASQQRPFQPSFINNYEVLMQIPSGKLASGDYFLSFHYHYLGTDYKWIDCNIITERFTDSASSWETVKPMRQASGFYDGYLVYEQKIKIDSASEYKFFLNGFSDKMYYIKNAMIYPSEKDIIIKKGNSLKLTNNYPF